MIKYSNVHLTLPLNLTASHDYMWNYILKIRHTFVVLIKAALNDMYEYIPLISYTL